VTDWIWIDETIAGAVHDRSLILHGGAAGVRDQGLLASAMARPQQQAAYGDDIDVFVLATAYTAGIVRNHPFIDGSKRTGFVVGILFLELNGARFTASEEAATRAVIGLAASELDDAAYVAFLRTNSVTV
jgi:death-on-curing protein